MKPARVPSLVLDASTALAWCFPDEASQYADDVLVALEGLTILVPAVWKLELANAILSGERKKRLKQPEIRFFVTLLEGLPVAEDQQPPVGSMGATLPLAREHALSAYDASCLELAIRHAAPLATLDAKLRRAAKDAGIAIFAA